MREVTLRHDEFIKLSSEILGIGESFSFQAHGSSMYPFIQDGNILTIESVSYPALKVGDIILYKSLGDRLVVHRIVGEKKQTDQQFFLTRGDALFHNDGWIYSDQVIGKVKSIQRDKKLITLDQKLLYLITYLWHKLYPIGPFFIKITLESKKGLSWVLRRFQMLKAYRIIARKLINNKINYHTATEQDAFKLSRFYGYYRLPEIKDPVGLLKNQLRNSNDYGYTFIASEREKIIGITILTTIPANKIIYPDWWIFGLTVRTCYRGAGIGEGLIHMAIEKASEKGGTRINLLVFEDNKVAANLYKKMGFYQISIPELDEQLEEDVERGNRRRIIMSRPL